MTKKIYIIVTAVVLIIAGAIYLLQFKKQGISSNGQQKSYDQSQKSVENPVASNQVVYDGSKFSPSNIVVKTGTTVTFTNQSSSGMWVASGPHPVHTNLPGFDALRIYGRGESYTYTFVKVGVWKYHNHISPSVFGSVTVQ